MTNGNNGTGDNNGNTPPPNNEESTGSANTGNSNIVPFRKPSAKSKGKATANSKSKGKDKASAKKPGVPPGLDFDTGFTPELGLGENIGLVEEEAEALTEEEKADFLEQTRADYEHVLKACAAARTGRQHDLALLDYQINTALRSHRVATGLYIKTEGAKGGASLNMIYNTIMALLNERAAILGTDDLKEWVVDKVAAPILEAQHRQDLVLAQHIYQKISSALPRNEALALFEDLRKIFVERGNLRRLQYEKTQDQVQGFLDTEKTKRGANLTSARAKAPKPVVPTS